MSALAVRIASHQLENACRAFVGGVTMALHMSADETLSHPIDELDRGVIGVIEAYQSVARDMPPSIP